MLDQIQTFVQLLLATLLGGVVGLERELGRKEAGLKTYTLVCLGSALFTILAINFLPVFLEEEAIIRADPIRII